MSESQEPVPARVPNIEVTENLSSNSHLSASVEHLVEVTRRLTVCNQLQSALENQSETLFTSDVPSEVAEEEEIKPATGDIHNPRAPSPHNLTGSDCTERQSPQCNTKKWARLLGISPEDIGDEEEFIVSFFNELKYVSLSHPCLLKGNNLPLTFRGSEKDL